MRKCIGPSILGFVVCDGDVCWSTYLYKYVYRYQLSEIIGLGGGRYLLNVSDKYVSAYVRMCARVHIYVWLSTGMYHCILI